MEGGDLQIVVTKAVFVPQVELFSELLSILGLIQPFLFYWSALVMYFLEVACIWFAVALDATHEVAPLIKNKFPDNSLQYKPIHVLLLGFTFAFYSSVLSFFWQKLFHGNDDLFSKKYEKLVDDQTGRTPPASTPENGGTPPA